MRIQDKKKKTEANINKLCDRRHSECLVPSVAPTHTLQDGVKPRRSGESIVRLENSGPARASF